MEINYDFLKHRIRRNGRTTNLIKQAIEFIELSDKDIMIIFVCNGNPDYYIDLTRKIVSEYSKNFSIKFSKNKLFIDNSQIYFMNNRNFEDAAVKGKLRGSRFILILDHGIDITRECFDMIAPNLIKNIDS